MQETQSFLINDTTRGEGEIAKKTRKRKRDVGAAWHEAAHDEYQKTVAGAVMRDATQARVRGRQKQARGDEGAGGREEGVT